MGKKFKVIAGAVGGKGKKIFYSGDIVDEANFPDGNAEKLVISKFLVPYEEIESGEKLPMAKVITDNLPDSKQSVDDSEIIIQDDLSKIEDAEEKKDDSQGDGEKPDPLMEEITVKELKEQLTGRGIPFKPNASKKELFDLWSE
jgi:hypothetical protein